MTKAHYAIATVLCLYTCGCAFDLTEIEERTRDARLSLHVDEGGSGSLSIVATFDPGIDKAGVARRVSDDVLRVNDTPVRPHEVRGDGLRVYRVDALPSADTLVIHAPRVDELEPLAAVRLQPIRLLSPDTIVVRRGGVIEVRIAGVASLPSSSRSFWTVVIRRAQGTPGLVSLSGMTQVPSSIQLPLQLLPPDVTLGVIEIQGSISDAPERLSDASVLQVTRSFRRTLFFRIQEAA